MVGHTFATESSAPPRMGLHIYLFGPPRVETQNHAVPIARRQARALLYRLAASDHPLPRENLCYLFWPEIREDVTRQNLSRLITILHHALPGPDSLVIRDDQVALNDQTVWSDVWAVKRLWASWEAGGEIDVLRRTFDLFEGAFLAGFSLPGSPEFEVWATTEREMWNRLVLNGLEALIDAEAQKQEYRRAIELAQRYLLRDELNERVHRQLIEFYARIGDRNGALRQYERCSIVLERELGVDPLPDTRALYRAVHDQRVIFPPQPVKSATSWAVPSLETSLIGRETALATLTEALAAARRNRFQAVLVVGEPGIGKSRLVQEFIAAVQDRALVFPGACYPETRASPYQPIVQALRSQLTLSSLPFSAGPLWLTDVARLLPELAAVHPPLTETRAAESGWSQVRIFEAIEGLIACLTGNLRPAILCVDDLHWADAATLDLLSYLAHHQAISSLLLVGTCRSEANACLAGLIEAASHRKHLIQLPLCGLEESDVGRLLQRFGGQLSISEASVRVLHQITGGNPFFLLEVIRSRIVSDRLSGDLSGREEFTIPDTVRAAVAARINRLSAGAHQVVEGAAVLGHAFGLELLSLTAGRSEVETVDGLEELVSHGLLSDISGAYQFRHEIVREVIYRDLSHYRLQLLHRRAAEAIETLRPGEVSALALHFERAGRPGRAARYALRAGQLAMHVFAHTEARSWADRALDLLDQEASMLQEPKALATNYRARIEALSLRGWALRLVGDMASYTLDLVEEARLVELLQDSHALAHVRQRQASAHNWFCSYRMALAVAEEGIRLSQQVGDERLEGMCWREVGLAARALGEYERAGTALRRALELVDAPEQAAVAVHLLGNLSTLYLQMGEPGQALRAAQQALERCEQSQLVYERRVPLGDVGAAAIAMGDLATARRCLEESLQISRQVTDRTQQILCSGHMGWLCLAQQHPEEAAGHLRAALALAEQVGSRAELSWLHAGLAAACRLTGDQAGARANAQLALSLAEETGQAYGRKLAEDAMQSVR